MTIYNLTREGSNILPSPLFTTCSCGNSILIPPEVLNMAITQRYLNLNSYFRSTEGPKIIVNDLSYFSMEDLNTINTTLMTVYGNSETISTKPQCDCGNLSGRYLVGKLCQDCGTTCTEPHDKIKPLLWLKTINDDIKFLNPSFWLSLTRLFHKKLDYLRYLCDSKYNPPVELPEHVVGVKNLLNGVRDYWNTMQHIPNILVYLLNHSKFKDPEKQIAVKSLIDIYNNHKDDLFSNFIPIINKKLFVVENTTKGKFINLASSDIIDVAMTWLKVCSEGEISAKRLSNTMGSVLSNLANLYNTYFNDYIVTKTGMFRKHVYGARSHFTFRNVIVSVPGRHEHDGLVVPWVVGLTAFRPHVLNKLVKRGYTFKEASNMIYKGIKNYNQVLSDILDELIAEAPGGKIRLLSHRNPRKLGHTLEIA